MRVNVSRVLLIIGSFLVNKSIDNVGDADIKTNKKVHKYL